MQNTSSWSVEEVSRNVHVIRFNNVAAGWRQYVLLSSDRHHDNIHSRHDLERRHLEQAKARNAPIIDAGDLFCAMQGKYDPRKMDSALRPEHMVDNYFDAVLDTAEEFYAPYAANFAVIGQGNHERSILKRQQINLSAHLTRRLRRETNATWPALGGYGGWVFFRFDTHSTLKLKYFHGAGGGGPVTRGVIQSNRYAVIYPDADFVMSGHTHDAWIVPIKQERLSERGALCTRNQYHIRTPTYKDEYGDGGDGWHVETGKPPKPLGACWLVFEYAPGAPGRIRYDAFLDIE